VVSVRNFDLVCFSHLRWSFVFQRPQHLLSRCARDRRVFFIEEPVACDGASRLEVSLSPEGVTVVVPHLNADDLERQDEVQTLLLGDFLARERVQDYVLWYYTPMALAISLDVAPLAVVYDCMDQLAAFKNAPPALMERERLLFSVADVVFTGGHALFEEKRALHANIHAFPSSVDVAHFAKAREPQPDPEDQRWLLRPRLGYAGVIDERMDLALLAGLAARRPDWQLVMVGPVVKIDPAELPRAANIHYLDAKRYEELPSYMSGWDVALLPFARNESTRFISPTKTPEYLAAGLPVVSTSIRDVVRPYRGLGLAQIGDSVDEVVAACEAALSEPAGVRLVKADAYLSRLSWDKTWNEMLSRIEAAIERRRAVAPLVARLDASMRELELAAGGK
jgi:glycosyltransferase involved in cell wall biosynthesis